MCVCYCVGASLQYIQIIQTKDQRLKGAHLNIINKHIQSALSYAL